ncbi:DUF4192 domain-containing protein [Rhodococcus sp. HM1]|uniref:DUF4192 family protein n=1 Tax=Rhodococcus sp. HM1 TaxID=2937759 RepID=UPI00200A3471|nr:DUF4192 family protein [Rhodococcus sp. HM1]MCK8674553.1 DUF4192 domain-containing protein [Rhodococcus sp. HM1]
MNNNENAPVTRLNLAQFVESIPAFLGMVPNESLVIALFDPAGKTGPFARLDHDNATAVVALDKLMAAAEGADFNATIVALVSAHPDGDTAEETLLAATRHAHTLGLAVPIATVLPEYAAGETFFNFPSAESGELGDILTSTVAVINAVDGRAPIAPSREALAAEIAPVEELGVLFERQWDARQARAQAPEITDAANLETLREAIEAPRVLTYPEAVAVAVTLADNPRARDVALYFSRNTAAVAVLTDAARKTSGYARFAILSVLAAAAYAHGYGARAAVALEAIENGVAHETQIPKLAVLMRQVVDHGMHAKGVQEVLESGRKVLPEFGFTPED